MVGSILLLGLLISLVGYMAWALLMPVFKKDGDE